LILFNSYSAYQIFKKSHKIKTSCETRSQKFVINWITGRTMDRVSNQLGIWLTRMIHDKIRTINNLATYKNDVIWCNVINPGDLWYHSQVPLVYTTYAPCLINMLRPSGAGTIKINTHLFIYEISNLEKVFIFITIRIDF
jgi:hypothetical protein